MVALEYGLQSSDTATANPALLSSNYDRECSEPALPSRAEIHMYRLTSRCRRYHPPLAAAGLDPCASYECHSRLRRQSAHVVCPAPSESAIEHPASNLIVASAMDDLFLSFHVCQRQGGGDWKELSSLSFHLLIAKVLDVFEKGASDSFRKMVKFEMAQCYSRKSLPFSKRGCGEENDVCAQPRGRRSNLFVGSRK